MLKKEAEQSEPAKLKCLTHSGCFIYAVSSALKLPNNTIPPYSKIDQDVTPALCNKQADWYETEGIKNGWTYIKAKDCDDNFVQAQKFSNQGYLVVAVYKNVNAKRIGHIVVVIPTNKNIEKVKLKGADIT